MRRHSRRGNSVFTSVFGISAGVLLLGSYALWPRASGSTSPTLIARADEPALPIATLAEDRKSPPAGDRASATFKAPWDQPKNTDQPAQPVTEKPSELRTAVNDQPRSAGSQAAVDQPAVQVPVTFDGDSTVSEYARAVDPDPQSANKEKSPQPRTAPEKDARSDEALKKPPAAASGSAADPQRETRPAATAPPGSPRARIEAAVRRFKEGEKVAARTELNAALSASTNPLEQEELRRHLTDFAEETIFSTMRVPGDPLCVDYQVKPRELIMNIARQFDVPHEMILAVNGISDPKRVPAGRTLKIPRGPFHVKVDKSDFRLDLYLQDLYVRSFRVGLGAQAGTPDGDWLVKDRVKSPTYYPPPSAEQTRVIRPGDPKNPLGDFWIGLKGVTGNAVGQESFGIHGTNEPDSIGTNSSLGCVRMHNSDVQYVFNMLLPGKSKVTIVP